MSRGQGNGDSEGCLTCVFACVESPNGPLEATGKRYVSVDKSAYRSGVEFLSSRCDFCLESVTSRSKTRHCLYLGSTSDLQNFYFSSTFTRHQLYIFSTLSLHFQSQNSTKIGPIRGKNVGNSRFFSALPHPNIERNSPRGPLHGHGANYAPLTMEKSIN